MTHANTFVKLKELVSLPVYPRGEVRERLKRSASKAAGNPTAD
jgi:hypothetical protein